MRSPWFKDIVQAQARIAAREVVETLGQIAQKPRDNAVEEAVIVPAEVVIERLEPAYRSALHLKADMVQSSKQYVAQFVGAGQDYNEAVMRFEGLGQAPSPKQLRICLFPIIGLCPVPDEEAAVQDDVGSPHIKYQTLSIATAREEAEGDILYKGVDVGLDYQGKSV
ncbi:hypothetical protein PG997_007553 [Apiospora hydei]|uniref:Uncharacterized protein n=1 Tax=Apiospora hydei TaxID=1337664 RepID=A0ABR1W8C5_9PEZI